MFGNFLLTTQPNSLAFQNYFFFCIYFKKENSRENIDSKDDEKRRIRKTAIQSINSRADGQKVSL